MSNTSAPANLGALLFGSSRREALALLLLRPESSLHLREIARLSGKAPGTLLRELNRLADAGILARSRRGNQVHFQANSACPIHDELRGILKKTSGIADVLRAALEPLGERVSLAFVYGSVARGDERGGSDLDLMIVGDVRFARVVEALQGASNALRREINPHLYPPREFAHLVAVGEPFVSRVMGDRKIYVIGDGNDVGEPGAHRKAEAPRRHKGRA